MSYSRNLKLCIIYIMRQMYERQRGDLRALVCSISPSVFNKFTVSNNFMVSKRFAGSERFNATIDFSCQ